MIDPSARIIDREWISNHIPHQGSMCLLDRVESWDDENIVCVASSHLHAENPLRIDGSLGIANAIEYAAQAMAVHSALLIDESAAPTSGYLTSVRDVHWHRSRFDDVTTELKICVRRFSGNEINVLYDFEISADTLLLMHGRASVMLNANSAASLR